MKDFHILRVFITTLLPCLLFVWFLWFFDQHRLLSRGMKLMAGGFIALLAAAGMEMFTIPLCDWLLPGAVIPARAFLGIALPEEVMKAVVLITVVRKRRNYKGVIDGAVYGISAAMGFALLENTLYITGAQDPLSTAMIRSVTAVPLHSLTGGLVGLALARKRILPRGTMGGALLLAVFIHGFYDFIIMSSRIHSILTVPLLLCGWLLLLYKIMKAHRIDTNQQP